MSRSHRPRKRAREAGNAVVELAIVFPVLVVLLAGLADFPRVFFWDMELTNAARAGAQFGSAQHNLWSDYSDIRETAANAAPELSRFIDEDDVNPVMSCYCASLTTGQNLGAVACNANAVTCSGRVVGTLRVGVSARFQRVFKMPFLPTTFNLGPDGGKPAQAIVRLLP